MKRISETKRFVRGGKEYEYRTRGTKTATGMSKTAATQGHRACHGDRHKIDRISVARGLPDIRIHLLVSGTMDELNGGTLYFRVEKKICECCGAKTGKLQLNKRGRQLLQTRKRRAQRQTTQPNP